MGTHGPHRCILSLSGRSALSGAEVNDDGRLARLFVVGKRVNQEAMNELAR
jgi:hypothetical protein